MEEGRKHMKEDNKLVIEEICVHFEGTDYEQFAQWLHANHIRFDEDGNGRFEIQELEHAVSEFQLEMEKDKARLSGKTVPESVQTMGHSQSLPNLGSSYLMTQNYRPANPYNALSMGDKMRTIRDYRTVAGYSSISRSGVIMGNIPHRASDWQDVADKLRVDLEGKKETRDRYEDTTFTGAASTSITKLPLASYNAGAHMHNYVTTKWGGWRSRYDKPILIKNTILPPEEREFLEQVKLSHTAPMWPKPMEDDLHWCQRLSMIPTMGSLIRSQNKYEELVGKMKHL